jgi:hypothetical protein
MTDRLEKTDHHEMTERLEMIVQEMIDAGET